MVMVRGAFWVSLHRLSDDGSSRSRLNRLFRPFRLYGLIIERTTISNFNIIYFHALYHFVKRKTHIYIAGNIMKNSKVHCLISECNCLVIILKVHIF